MTDKPSAGRALQRVFRQEDRLKGIRPQMARLSLLMNTARMRIFLHLCHAPCAHLRGIARALKLSAPTTSWHLKKMVHAGYVEIAKSGRQNIYWISGMIEQKDLMRFAALQDKGLKSVLAVVLRANGDVRERDIVKTTGCEQQLVHVRLKRLAEVGLLQKDGKGIGARFSASPDIEEMKQRYGARVQHFVALLVSIFDIDGLMPKSIKHRGSKITAEVILPSGREKMTVECNPTVSALRRIK